MAKKSKKKKAIAKRSGFKAFLICLVLFALIALLVRTIVFVPVKVGSNAMASDYLIGDTVIADKLSVIKGYAPSRGDVVYAEFTSADVKLIRRVAGLPGDLIESREDGKYLVYSGGEVALGRAAGLSGGIIPEGAYLLLTDDGSELDSRTLGLIFGSSIIAKPVTKIWPLRRAF